MKLFSEVTRSETDPSKFNENKYDYYNRTARSDCETIRNSLETWFDKYPDYEKAELKSRFQKTFSDAFFELFLHQLFLKQGFSITIHPEIEGTSKRPDFLISKGNVELYIEAKEAKDKTRQEETMENIENEIFDSLNNLELDDYFLTIGELTLKKGIQPSTKEIKRKVLSFVESTTPEKLSQELAEYGLKDNNWITYEDENCFISVSLIPKIKAHKVRPLGILPTKMKWGGSQESIKNSIKKKANRYGKLDKPYIICINATGILGNGSYDVENTLWGESLVNRPIDSSKGYPQFEDYKKGLFSDERGPKIKNVSALIITNVMEFNIPVANFWFVKHPFSNNTIDLDLFHLKKTEVLNGKITHLPGKDFGEVMNIPIDWLSM